MARTSEPPGEQVVRDTTIITVAYNSAHVLKTFWTNFRPEWAEWIVVDNGSSDDSVRVAKALGARVIEPGANLGFSRANNLGAANANSSILLFCNPDVSVTEQGIRRLAELASGSSAIYAPQLLNSDGTNQENGRGTPFPHRKIAHMFFKAASARGRYTRIAPPGKTIPVVWVMGAAVAMSRFTFQRIQGWDERYFLYYEDSDICIRAHEKDIPSYVVGEVRWTHGWARETSRSLSISIWKRELRSALRFYRSHPHCVIPYGKRARALANIDRIEA